MPAWKKKPEERNKSMLERVFNSDFAKKWIKERDIKEEVEFYGKERTEQEWKSDLLTEFFEQDLKSIATVLPEIWEEIKEAVKEELECTVLENPEKFERQTSYLIGRGCIKIDFNFSGHLEYVENDLQKLLKQ